jgi:hypothetical protein
MSTNAKTNKKITKKSSTKPMFAKKVEGKTLNVKTGINAGREGTAKLTA